LKAGGGFVRHVGVCGLRIGFACVAGAMFGVWDDPLVFVRIKMKGALMRH